MDDPVYASVRELAQAIRSKAISAEETVKAYLKRIAVVNPKLNAVVQLTADTALQQAREADVALAQGDSKGPLHGIPMTIKDSLDTAGVISTGGTKGRASFVPTQDATVVARLRTAGAILLGKTNTPELTLDGRTDNFIYGRTNNPYDLSRHPGGSSGGPAAIVAAGGSPLDLGSDTGGSIRLPAHYCGISGIKPTAGRVPRTGHIISFDMGALDALTQIGPMARYVEDLILTLPLISGPDWRDPAAVFVPANDPTVVDLKKLRVTFYTDDGVGSPTPETIDAVRAAARVLSDASLVVEEERPPEIEHTSDMWNQLFKADGGAWVRRLLQMAGTTKSHPSIQWTQGESVMSTTEFTHLLTKWDMFRSTMLSFLKKYDVIICPVTDYPALPHDDVPGHGVDYTATYNLTGWPSVVFRGGTSPEGLPIGVQVVARPWREDTALAVAQHLERTLGGWQRPSF